jgi:FkbM family methyltransferase
MISKLPFLFRKSRRRLLTALQDLLRSGYSTDQIADLIKLVKVKNLKADGIKDALRAVRENEKLKEKNKRLQKIKRIIAKPGLNGLDDKLAPYLNFMGGFFIEAGANDGYTQSNTYHLENTLGWRGVLVEAIPELAESCRGKRLFSKVFECALVSSSETCKTVKMHYANLMSLVEGSFGGTEATQEHVRKGVEVQSLPASYSIDVKTRTLTSVLDESGVNRQIDFFSLDVEGYEEEVLNGLDLSKYAPTFILVETAKPDVISALLSERYAMVEKLTFHDYLFKLKEL